MFDVLNKLPDPTTHTLVPRSSTLHTSQELYAFNETNFVPFSFLDLKEIKEALTFLSSIAADEHLLLHTGAPRPICSKDWLHKANWHPLEKVQTPESILLFRFAGHPVRALYRV